MRKHPWQIQYLALRDAANDWEAETGERDDYPARWLRDRAEEIKDVATRDPSRCAVCSGLWGDGSTHMGC